MSAGITLKGIGSVTINGDATGPAITVTDGLRRCPAHARHRQDRSKKHSRQRWTTSCWVIDTAASYSSITFQKGDITGGAYAGFFLNNATNVSGVTIDTANFSGAAPVDSLSSGESEIYFYHYNGNVTLKGVNVTGPGSVGGGSNTASK